MAVMDHSSRGGKTHVGFSALPLRWRRVILALGLAALLLLLTLVLYVHATLGSLIHVMVG